MIWKLLLPGPRIVHIEHQKLKAKFCLRVRNDCPVEEDDRPSAHWRHGCFSFSSRLWAPRSFNQPVPIALLATCRESYEVASKAYPRITEKPLERLTNPDAFSTLGETPDILFSFTEDMLYLSHRSLRKLRKFRQISPYTVAEGSDYLGVDLNRVEKLALGFGADFDFEDDIPDIDEVWISKVLSWFNNLKQVTFVVEHHDIDAGSNPIFMDLVDIPFLSSLYEEGYSQSHNLRGLLRHEQSYALEARDRLRDEERVVLNRRNHEIEEAFARVLQARPHVAAKIEEEFARALQTRPHITTRMGWRGGFVPKYRLTAKIEVLFAEVVQSRPHVTANIDESITPVDNALSEQDILALEKIRCWSTPEFDRRIITTPEKKAAFEDARRSYFQQVSLDRRIVYVKLRDVDMEPFEFVANPMSTIEEMALAFGRAHQLDSTKLLTRWDDDDDRRDVLKPCLRMFEIGDVEEGACFTVVVAS